MAGGAPSDEARAVGRALSWLQWIAVIGIAAMVTDAFRAFSEQDFETPVIALIPIYLVVLLPLSIVAQRAARRGDLSAALLLSSAILWIMGVAIAVITPESTMIGLLAALPPAALPPEETKMA